MKAGIVASICLAASWAVAQESTNRVSENTDWSVFAEPADGPKECWGVSAPKETVNTRDGRVVAVRRSDILLFVTYRPGNGGSPEVSFTGGYPFADGSTVSMQVGDSTFELFTEGEFAWPAPEDDAKIVAAMKRGADSVLTARSARGTQTKDTFSLLGFTAAQEDAAKRCSG
ncbi:invasion associated locus B family protein [Actibacterium sp. 188UL27-1]|uniref:invasion associated locus B family protein n=1 Tax=Actibacterium sp. 188UL27-1 TaxID=2786961 RepID=UPI00351C761D